MEKTMTTTIKVDASKNCKGVGCPMNLVHAKVGLAKLQSGQIMELILDDGAPINNVPGSVLKEGHKVLEKSQLEDGTWRLLIQKA
jgi:sulfite reductase (ferredoxin)